MKNNIFKNIGLLVLGLSVLSSCTEDFITVYPNSFAPVDKIVESAENDPELIAGQLNGIYATMIETGTGGTTRHTDFGQKGYDIFSDMLSGDLALTQNTYNWFGAWTQLQTTQDYTFLDNYTPWRYYYRIIRSTNFLIASAGGNDFVPEEAELSYLIGQAKALRAYSYFYLAQFYINGSYNPAEPGVPLYFDPETTAQGKAPSEEVYAAIIADLESAISLMDGFTRSTKNQIDVNVAKGLLAYTHAAMGNDTEAARLTNEIILDGSYTIMSAAEITGGFNDAATPGWMWGQDITLDNGLGLISWWGQMDRYTYSYQWAGDIKAMDANLYAQIPADDARYGQFESNPASPYYRSHLNKFYDPAKQIGGQRNVETDYLYMRISEIYLLNAESNAKAGNDAAARTSLKAVLSQRLADVSYVDGLAGSRLLDEIILQTRIELYAEGKSYLLLKRNQLTVNRGANHLSNVGVAIPYDDTRLTYEVPQAEVLNNPNID